MQAQTNSVTHFPGFGLLRFMLALAVIVSHIELFCLRLGFQNSYNNAVVSESGRVAVSFFFVLSGFLITYLLLQERTQTSTIQIRKFYMRRILRIWPLYFLVLGVAFFIVPHFISETFVIKEAEMPSVHLPENLFLYIAFLPQLALSLWPPVFLAEPLWSIGVEENFYLLWPWLGKYIKRGFWLLLLFILILFPLLRWWSQMACETATSPEAYKTAANWFSFLYYTRFECIAAGGLMAWLFMNHKKTKGINWLAHPVTQLAALAGIVGWFCWFTPPVYHYLFPSVCFAVLLFGIANRQKPLLPKTDFLGNYSYAMYLVHEFVIAGILWLLLKTKLVNINSTGGKVLLYLAVIAGTMLMSWLLYRFYESYFLRLKKRWGVLK